MARFGGVNILLRVKLREAICATMQARRSAVHSPDTDNQTHLWVIACLLLFLLTPEELVPLTLGVLSASNASAPAQSTPAGRVKALSAVNSSQSTPPQAAQTTRNLSLSPPQLAVAVYIVVPPLRGRKDT
eukprot:2301212-Prymnesium_polylepis.1